MEIGKWKLAQSWIHHPEPKDSRGVWDDLVKVANAEWKTKERDQMAQGGVPQLVQPGPGRQGYKGDDELGRGLTEFVDPKNDKIYYRFETKFPDGSYYRKRLEKNPKNLEIMKGRFFILPN